MKLMLFSACALILLSGCIIDISEGKWPDDPGDTGSMSTADLDQPIYRVTPDLLSPGANEVLTITTDTMVNWDGLLDVTAIGDLEVMDFKSDGTQLWVGVIVPEEALDGPAHLIFEFEDGEVHFAREVLMIDDLEEAEEEDTGLVDDEPNND